MKPNFALTLSHDGICLMHRTKGGWMVLDEVRPDDPTLEERLGYLRATALGLEPHGMRTQLVIPDSEILYAEIVAPGPSEAERQAQIETALEGMTPYAVAELAYDWFGDGPQLKVAVVARETLQEAEEFAARHRLSPYCFAAAPEDEERFDGAPFFGLAVAAQDLAGKDASAVREATPARPSGRAEALPAAAGQGVAAVQDIAEAPDSVAVMDSAEGSATDDTEGEEAAPAQTFRSRRATPPPRTADAGQTGAETGSTQPSHAPDPEADPVDATLRADTTARREPQIAAPKSAAAPAPPPGPAVGPESEAEALTIFGARPKPRTRRGAPPRWQLIVGLGAVFAAAVALWAGFLWWTDPARLGDMVDTVQEDIASASPDAPASDDVPAQPEPDAPSTGNGAAGDADALAGIAAGPDDAAEGVAAQEDAAPAADLDTAASPPATPLDEAPGEAPEDAAPPAPSPSAMLDTDPAPQGAAPDTDTATSMPDAETAPRTGTLAPLPDGDETAPPDTLPQFDTDAALAELFSDPSTAEDDAIPPSPQPGPDVASTAPTLPRAARGGPRSVPALPGRIDPPVASLDAFALPQVAGARPLPPPPLVPPPPFGAQFALDPRGLVEATEDGALSPEGVRITAGRPAQVPPARAAALTEPIPVFGADPELAGLRPEPRPATPPDPEDAAPADIDASAEPLLQEPEQSPAIPPPPPRTEDLAEVVAADPFADASRLAVAATPRPAGRPSGFAEVVRSARATQPEAQPEAQPDPEPSAPAAAPTQPQPDIPTQATVAQAATEEGAINLRNMTLIGVFGSSANRRALLRLPNGRMVRVQQGDTVDGGRVAAIGENRVQYVKNGRNTVLEVGSDG